jgi:hypothetical protein
LWGDEPWFIDLKTTGDDAGKTIDIIVNMDLYPYSDPIPRRFNNISICVLKKPVIIRSKEFVSMTPTPEPDIIV